MPIVLRLCEEPDYEEAAALLNACYPERQERVEVWREADHQEPRRWLRRYKAITLIGQEIVGYGSAWHVIRSKYRMDLAVAPEWRRLGIGEMLLGWILAEVTAEGAHTLQAR